MGTLKVLFITSVICSVPAGSAATFTPAVPWAGPADIVGAGQLNIVPAGLLPGVSNTS